MKASEKYKLETCYFTEIFIVCKIFDNCSVYTMQETCCKDEVSEIEAHHFLNTEYLKNTFLITEKDDLSLALINFLSSISTTNKYFKSKSTLNHKPFFLDSNNQKTFQYEYMKVASDFKVGVIVIDIDEQVADIIEGRILKNPDAPLPNLIIKNQVNKHVQLFYFLKNWVCIDLSNKYKNYSQKSYNFYKLIKKRLNEVLNGDACYQNYICKNPMFKNASVHSMRIDKYTLGELARVTDLKVENHSNYIVNTIAKKIKKEKNIIGIGQRNNFIFDTMRFHAYSLYRQYIDLSEDELALILLNECKELNHRVCDPALSDSEIEKISTSISNFCTSRYLFTAKRENKIPLAVEMGKKGGKNKGKSYEQQRKYALKLLKQDIAVVDIVKRTKLSRSTVFKLKKEQKMTKKSK